LNRSPTTSLKSPQIGSLPGVGVLIADSSGTVLAVDATAAQLLGCAGRDPLTPIKLSAMIEGADRMLERLLSDAVGAAQVAAGDDDPLLPAESLVESNADKQASLKGIKVHDRAAWLDLYAQRAVGATLESLRTTIPGLRERPGPVCRVTVIDATGRVVAETELLRLRARFSESERARQRLTSVQREIVAEATGQEMIGASVPLRRVREQVSKVAATNTTVLIQGETGSGKELVARSLHALSGRRVEAFVAVNCGALPESLIESELFGHERGAFTGADRRKLGKFEIADGGTLFLDEIAELPLASQSKLLRVLQESAFERVGGSETVKVDVRLVAATHRDLARQVERGRFREDLFYRLNVFRIDVPPLRDRKEDVRALIEHLHTRIANRMAKPVLPISERSLRRVMAYAWPGNVRELANAVERATLLADSNELEIELPESPMLNLPGYQRAGNSGAAGGAAGASAGEGGRSPRSLPAGRDSALSGTDVLLDLSLEQLQRLHIVHALDQCGYRVFGADGAAARLDLNPRTLLSRMDKYGIPRPRLMHGGNRPADGSG